MKGLEGRGENWDRGTLEAEEEAQDPEGGHEQRRERPTQRRIKTKRNRCERETDQNKSRSPPKIASGIEVNASINFVCVLANPLRIPCYCEFLRMHLYESVNVTSTFPSSISRRRERVMFKRHRL
jgi:hypothetical protein